jgi:ribosomal protein L29
MGRYIMTVEQIRRLSDQELAKEIEEAYRRLFQLRLQKELRQLQNHREIWKRRRHLARLKTEQRARQEVR